MFSCLIDLELHFTCLISFVTLSFVAKIMGYLCKFTLDDLGSGIEIGTEDCDIIRICIMLQYLTVGI